MEQKKAIMRYAVKEYRKVSRPYYKVLKSVRVLGFHVCWIDATDTVYYNYQFAFKEAMKLSNYKPILFLYGY